MWMILLTYREARELSSLYVKTILFTLIFIHPLMKSGVRASADGGSGKGEDCTSDTDCDRTKFLQCLDHSCKCRGAEGLIWDNEVNSCAAMESEPCDDNFNMSEIKCITNSSCEYGVCSCNEGFLRDGFGLCFLSYGSVCSENDDKCAARYDLRCVKTSPNSQPTCKCLGESVLVWDDMRRKCVSTANGSCDIYTGKDDQLECVENAECTDQGYCKCKEGFVQTPDGLCKLSYLSENCSSTDGRNHCNNFEFLVCRDNRCQCEFYGQMEYDNYSKRCKLLVGESCDPLGNGKWKPQCVDNANCVPRQGRGPHRGICQCVHPYVESERTCSRGGYGQQCNASMDCNVKKFLQCIEDDVLGGHCRCIPNEMFWDGDRCRVYPGKRCSENRHCANNSYCEGTWCTCNQDYVFFNSFCVKPHEAFKATSTTIRSRQYVPDSSSGYYDNNCGHYYEHDSLIGRMCECQQKQGSHVWIPEKNACLALVGTPCLSVDECIPDADCHFDAGICQCSLGALATMNKTCIKINRQSTHNYHQDHEHFHECIESNTLKSVSKAPAGLPVAEHNFLFALVAIILSQYCYLNLVINDKVIS